MTPRPGRPGATVVECDGWDVEGLDEEGLF